MQAQQGAKNRKKKKKVVQEQGWYIAVRALNIPYYSPKLIITIIIIATGKITTVSPIIKNNYFAMMFHLLPSKYVQKFAIISPEY